MARIILALRNPAADPADYQHPNVESACGRCGRAHDALWEIRRELADTFGPWPVYRIGHPGMRRPNGRYAPILAVVDGSLPHTVDILPRDARPIPAEDAARYWHDDNESHTFGGPNVAAALRSAIAAGNARAIGGRP